MTKNRYSAKPAQVMHTSYKSEDCNVAFKFKFNMVTARNDNFNHHTAIRFHPEIAVTIKTSTLGRARVRSWLMQCLMILVTCTITDSNEMDENEEEVLTP